MARRGAPAPLGRFDPLAACVSLWRGSSWRFRFALTRGDVAAVCPGRGLWGGGLMLRPPRAFLLGVQGLVEQHFEVGLVPQSFFGGEDFGSGEVAFRQADCNRWSGAGLCGPLTRRLRHGSLAEFAGGGGLLEAVCDKFLIILPPIGFLAFCFEGWQFRRHFGSPLLLLVVELNEAFDWFKRGYHADPVFTPCSHDEENAACICWA